DWAGSTSDAKSTSGYICFFANGAISWKSQKQSTVALSTAEAEYIAAALAACENYALRRLLDATSMKQLHPTPFNIDNTVAIKYINDDNNDKRKKHIDIKYHYVKEQWKNGELEPKWIESENNVADIFTKPLTERKFIPLRNKVLGISD